MPSVSSTRSATLTTRESLDSRASLQRFPSTRTAFQGSMTTPTGPTSRPVGIARRVALFAPAYGSSLSPLLQFHAAIASNEPAYLDALHSYTEQRDIATVLGLGYLGDHPLAANISARMLALVPAVPNVTGYAPVPAAAWSTPVTVGAVTLGFDGTTGALTSLILAGVEWADAAHPLAQYVYRTYNDSDYDAQVMQGNVWVRVTRATVDAAPRPVRRRVTRVATGRAAVRPAPTRSRRRPTPR